MGGPGSGRKGGYQIGCSQPCGTKTKYNYHRKRGENCQVCKDANAAVSRAKSGYQPRKFKLRPAEKKQDRKNWLIKQKMSRVACMDCGLKVQPDNTFVFDYDHRDVHLKSFAISMYLHQYTEYRLLQEMDKCDLICSNCHRFRTHAQQQAGILTGFKKDTKCHEGLNSQDWLLTLF